jgi:hypothetical protein
VVRIRVLGDGSIKADLGLLGGGLGCKNKVLGERNIRVELGVIWGLNSKVKKPLLNLVLLLDEIQNMKPNGNGKKVMKFYRYLE